MATQCIVMANQKGGCGKSTLAIGLAIGYAKKGKDVLIVDLDNQRTVWKHWHRSFEDDERCPETDEPLGKVSNNFPLEVKALRADSMEHLIESILTYNEEFLAETGRTYDYIFIDTPPNPEGSILSAALLISDTAIVPFVPDLYHVDSLEEFYILCAEVNKVRREQNRLPLRIRFIANRFNKGRGTDESVAKYLNQLIPVWRERGNMDVSVLNTRLYTRALIVRALNTRKTLYTMPNNREIVNIFSDMIEEIS